MQALGKKKWSADKTSRVADILRSGYISSEESDYEPEPPHSRCGYVIRPLSWESDRLKKVKRSLDKQHERGLPELVRKRVLKRSVGPPSDRPKPDNCPDWASGDVAGTARD